LAKSARVFAITANNERVARFKHRFIGCFKKGIKGIEALGYWREKLKVLYKSLNAIHGGVNTFLDYAKKGWEIFRQCFFWAMFSLLLYPIYFITTQYISRFGNWQMAIMGSLIWLLFIRVMMKPGWLILQCGLSTIYQKVFSKEFGEK
jgi:hypothetical protein